MAVVGSWSRDCEEDACLFVVGVAGQEGSDIKKEKLTARLHPLLARVCSARVYPSSFVFLLSHLSHSWFGLCAVTDSAVPFAHCYAMEYICYFRREYSPFPLK